MILREELEMKEKKRKRKREKKNWKTEGFERGPTMEVNIERKMHRMRSLGGVAQRGARDTRRKRYALGRCRRTCRNWYKERPRCQNRGHGAEH
jgi:hypothetical protein